MSTPVDPKYFQDHDAVAVAPWLLGRILVRAAVDGGVTRHVITETEAYNGPEDKACHASKGRTARTDVMFRPGGVWYVYLCYGMHEMLNLVVGPEDFPAAVLIRGVQGAEGPGRVTKRLGINRTLNGLPATKASGLFIEDAGSVVSKKWIQTSPRIGVDYAGPVWAGKRWRFVLRPEWPGFAARSA